MESRPLSSGNLDPAAARLTSPDWYHPALGLSFAFAFASPSISWTLIPYGVILGLLLVPMVLTMIVGHRSGISADRYLSTPGAHRLSMVYSLLLVLLVAAGIALQWGADLRWAMAGCAVVVFVLTIGMGRSIETALARDVRIGR
jgi:hypothetical protein